MKSGSYVSEYINNFINNEPISGIEFEYMLSKQLAPQISVEMVNQAMKQFMTENNQVVLVAGPEKEGVKYPTKEDIVALLKSVKSFKLEPYVDKVSNEPLISEDI